MVSRSLSLRVRISIAMMLLFLIGMLVLYIAAFAYGKTTADRFYDRLLAGAARSIAETLVETGSGFDVDIPYSAFDLLNAAPDDRVFYRIFDSTGATVTGYPDLPVSPKKASSTPNEYRSDASFFTASYRGDRVRFVVVGRLSTIGTPVRTVWVQVGQTRRANQALANDLILRSLLPIASMTVMAICVVWFGLGRTLRPLRKIGEELTARSPEDLAPIDAPVPAEVEDMVAALNGFMARLDGNIGTLKELVSQAAHQLRTPLAAIQAQAQVANRSNVQELGQSLDAVERNAAKLTRMINQMLSDATMSHRSDMPFTTSLDLIEIVHEAVHEATAFQQSVVCTLDIPMDAAPLNGDPLMLTEGLRNVIDNAVRHGGGVIDIALRLVADGYVIEVGDRGVGIDDVDKPEAFKRFVRGSTHVNGAGLGLAIARRAIERHGGTVELADRQEGGLIVRFLLPLGATA